jgi:hypothetical protein
MARLVFVDGLALADFLSPGARLPRTARSGECSFLIDAEDSLGRVNVNSLCSIDRRNPPARTVMVASARAGGRRLRPLRRAGRLCAFEALWVSPEPSESERWALDLQAEDGTQANGND